LSGKVAGLIRDWLARQSGGPSVALCRGDTPGAFCGAYDLFVVGTMVAPACHSERSEESFRPFATLRVTCRALLTPGDGGTDTLAISSKWVVSYGLAVRDSITVSSLEPDHAVLALQRELVTLDGAVIERQELPLPIPPNTGAEGVMALYGSLLILGVPPEELGR